MSINNRLFDLKPQRDDIFRLRRLIEQRLGLLQDWCIKTFGKPVVDRHEQVMIGDRYVKDQAAFIASLFDIAA